MGRRPRHRRCRDVDNHQEEATVGHVTSEQVWRAVDKASFAVLSYVTPSGEPRSSGVVYKVLDRRLYVAVEPDGWKATHVDAAGRVAVTVPVRRGGLCRSSRRSLRRP